MVFGHTIGATQKKKPAANVSGHCPKAKQDFAEPESTSVTSAHSSSLIKYSRMPLFVCMLYYFWGLLHFFHMLLQQLAWTLRLCVGPFTARLPADSVGVCRKCINTCVWPKLPHTNGLLQSSSHKQALVFQALLFLGAGPAICGAELLSVPRLGIHPPRICHVFPEREPLPHRCVSHGDVKLCERAAQSNSLSLCVCACVHMCVYVCLCAQGSTMSP